MATPEMPRDDLVKWMREMESRIAAAEKRDPFINSGISIPSAGNMSVDGNLTINGNLTATGKISNAALVNPVAFDGNGGAATNFAVSTTGASSALYSVTNKVPTGMTKMASIVIANVTAINSTASLDYLQSRVGITGPTGTNYAGNSGYAPVGASGGSQQVSASKYGILTGLTGGQTVTHYVNVWSSTASWAANASNVADLQALILWGA